MNERVELVSDRDVLSILDLPELAAEAKREHSLASAALSDAVQHAIRVGEVLLVARDRVERGGWKDWVESTGISSGLAYVYMRVAEYRHELPEEEPMSLNAAYAFLRGKSLPPSGNRWKYPDEVREEAIRLKQEGEFGHVEIAELLGVSPASVTYWTDPEYRKKHQAKSRSRQRRKRAAAKALAEKEKQQTRESAAKRAGGAIDRAYSQLRLHIAALDQAIHEASDRSTRAVLREALDHAYKAEDKIAEALKVQ